MKLINKDMLDFLKTKYKISVIGYGIYVIKYKHWFQFKYRCFPYDSHEDDYGFKSYDFLTYDNEYDALSDLHLIKKNYIDEYFFSKKWRIIPFEGKKFMIKYKNWWHFNFKNYYTYSINEKNASKDGKCVYALYKDYNEAIRDLKIFSKIN